VRDLRKEAGTVFLVSHTNQSIRDTCERSIWLESGLIRADGPTDEVLKQYEAYMGK
jgi:teichoic acid transport system ATP-binding protein